MQEDAAKKVSKKTVKKQTTKKTVKKPKITIPKIAAYGKPSCRSCCHRKYVWYKKTYHNYCPNCKRHNCLKKNPKGVPESELTCAYCDCDYCVVCGHDKSGGSRHYRNKLKEG